jgi:FkbM family methyltransferase
MASSARTPTALDARKVHAFREGTLALRRELFALLRTEAPFLDLPNGVKPTALNEDLRRLAASTPEQALGYLELIDQIRMLAGLLCAHRGPERGRVLERLRPVATPVPVAGGWVQLDFRIYRDLRTLALGAWEPQNAAFLSERMAPGQVVLDVGAHVGHFTILAAARVGSARAGRVLAFEPAPSNLDRLRRNLTLNELGPGVEVLPLALGARPGTATFFDDGDSDGTEFSMVAPRQSGAARAFEATVETLDGICAARGIERVDVVKIDVEGAEVDVLRGAERVLAASPEVTLLIELHPWVTPPREVLAPLAERGYRLYDVKAVADQLTLERALEVFAKGGDVAAIKGQDP